MAAIAHLWTPPDGMTPAVVVTWRAFYSRAMDRYNITPDQYRLLYIAQKGRCWICRTAKGVHPDDPKGRGSRRLGIDHHHGTGQVRGLLCTGGDKTCNRIIGWLTAPALRRAADYLEGRVPATVLDEVRSVEQVMNEAGVTMTSQERDKMAQAWLWAAQPS